MNVYLDDQPVAVADAETLTVQQVADRVREELADRGRLLTSLTCDSQVVATRDLEDVLGRSANAYDSIEFQSSDARQLVNTLLTAAAGLFEEADHRRIEAADLLNEGQTGKAMEVLSACFQAWAQIHQSIIQTSNVLHVDLSDIRAGDLDVARWLLSLADRLRALKEALESSDHVSVADILRYEFDDVSKQWNVIIGALRATAES